LKKGGGEIMNIFKDIIEKKYPGKLFLTVSEATELCGLNINTIYNRKSKGLEIPFRIKKMGGKMMVSIHELIKLANEEGGSAKL
jgi:hypothetical protein